MSKLNRKVVLITGASEGAEHVFITEHRQETLDEPIKKISTIVPLTWTGMPDKTVKTAVFRTSDDSSYITRIKLFVDGGKE
ncbi:unnamed protein product [Adineta steineri]|uniref:Uncharacterized protein n=1 Tax=Adineta steineri TaxID=433720 RepID=A0A815DN99_9BILA|nr:unnamed protein product [Adineta steineri]CAF4158828.1 unnamed protein product [Adineta steineri]